MKNICSPEIMQLIGTAYVPSCDRFTKKTKTKQKNKNKNQQQQEYGEHIFFLLQDIHTFGN
jgi:hypothetical protein